MNEKENRRSFRILETVYLKYETLTEDEFQGGLERRKLRLGVDDGAQSRLVDIEARLAETMYLLGAENEKAARCITLMNDKLNLVIEQLPALRRTKSALTTEPPQTCELGADGMVFGSPEQIAVGTLIHLQMLLEAGNRYIETFAKVIRLTDPPSSGQSALAHGIAVEFHGMQPAVREILIQHMFSRESETLRMRRLQAEAAKLQD